MKASDYIAEFLVSQGVKHTFGITGGVITHIFDSIDKNHNIQNIPGVHEQGSAMAADAYSRITKNLGVVVTTSGPGATNLVTGVACSYFDSIPVLAITGQVSRAHLRKNLGVRQYGFQETDIVSLFKSITKYAKQIENPEDIRYELEKAVYLAKNGRPGPVVLDIPEDLHWSEINPEELKSYIPEKKEVDLSSLEGKINESISLIENAEKPVIILGNGIRLRNEEERARNLVERLGIPCLLTWATKDILPYNHELCVEGFGISSNRYGNFAVQSSDLILSIGTRLDTHEAGSDYSKFAPNAKKIVVDIDEEELKKYAERGMFCEVLVESDVKDFFDIIEKKNIRVRDISKWKDKINSWKERYPVCLPQYSQQEQNVNTYVLMDVLSQELKEGDIIITDAGGNLTWTMQGFRTKEKQRLFSAFNHSPMGYALPASIGACFANDKKPVYCIIGDGGIQMNIQDLALIKKHELPIKIILVDNKGYGIIQQTQDTWMGSRYVGSNSEGGVALPNISEIARAYGIPSMEIKNHKDLRVRLENLIKYRGAVLCDVKVNQHQLIMPKLEFGRPIEDLAPLLDREEFKRVMGE